MCEQEVAVRVCLFWWSIFDKWDSWVDICMYIYVHKSMSVVDSDSVVSAVHVLIDYLHEIIMSPTDCIYQYIY